MVEYIVYLRLIPAHSHSFPKKRSIPIQNGLLVLEKYS